MRWDETEIPSLHHFWRGLWGLPPHQRPRCGVKRQNNFAKGQKAIQQLLIEPSFDLSFRNETEKHYFYSLREEITPRLRGDLWIECPTVIWETIISQAWHPEGYLREAAVASVALRKALTTNDSISAQHYCFALQRYGSAIQSLWRALNCRTEDLFRRLY